MMKAAAIALLVATVPVAVVGQPTLDDVQYSNIDNVRPPQYDLTNVTMSFFMTCTETTGVCFMATTNPGVFNRAGFYTNFKTAFDTVSTAVRQRESGDSTATGFSLSASNYYLNRVMEQTNPFSQPAVKAFDEVTLAATTTTGADYWNVLVRFSLVEIPVEVADVLREVVAQLEADYAGSASILYKSIWIDREAEFITDKFENVEGRGHKDRKLIIPLIMGVFMMLFIPTLISAFLVMIAKKGHKADAKRRKRDRVIERLQDNMMTKNATIEQNRELLMKQEETDGREMEKLTLRDNADMGREDVDWDAKPEAQVPY